MGRLVALAVLVGSALAVAEPASPGPGTPTPAGVPAASPAPAGSASPAPATTAPGAAVAPGTGSTTVPMTTDAPAPRPKRPTMAVLPVTAPAPLDPQLAPLLAETIATTVQRSNAFEVTAPQDIAAMLGLERQKQLLGCGESDCLLEIANALDATWSISGSVSDLGKKAVLTLTLLDPKHARAVDRQTVEVEKKTELLVAGTKALTRKLLESIGVRESAEELEVVVRKDPTVVKRTVSLVVGAVGVATLGVAVALDAMAASAFAEEKRAAAAVDPEAWDAAKQKAASLVGPARLAYVGGAVLTAAGVAGVLLFRPPPEKPAVTVTPLLLPDGSAFVSLGGTF